MDLGQRKSFRNIWPFWKTQLGKKIHGVYETDTFAYLYFLKRVEAHDRVRIGYIIL